MPFTPAHIAAALPFRHSRLVWSALVIGTMAPDFEYFIRFEPGLPYGHRFPGVFLVTLPLALVTLWLFHAYVKAPFVALLPAGFRHRLAPYMGKFWFGGPGRFGLIVVSVLIGVLTHIAWDSFTHGNAWLVRYLPLLQTPIHLHRVRTVPLYKLLQHGSTLFGLTVLAVAVLAWYRRTDVSAPASTQSIWPQRQILTLAGTAFIAVAAGIAYASVMLGLPARQSSISTYVGRMVVTAIAVAWWEFVTMGIIHSKRKSENTASS